MDANIVCRGCQNTGTDFAGKPCACKLAHLQQVLKKCLLCREPLLDDGRCIVCEADPDTQSK